ncbi:MAG: hypothetical protein HUK03_01360 [Bacteroidaceae bacterium]|nr:hypothetical protein [Bacteroidaceae bacterium]MCF0195891.1 hypothetical protein [Bacteroidaceae bacterium]
MRKVISICLLVTFLCTVAKPIHAEDKRENRIAYVIRSLRLDKKQAAVLRPHLEKYYEEMANVKSSHKALKKKYKEAEEQNELTAEQCDNLFESKMKQEAGELDVKKRFYVTFRSAIGSQKAYKAIKLADDKLK